MRWPWSPKPPFDEHDARGVLALVDGNIVERLRNMGSRPDVLQFTERTVAEARRRYAAYPDAFEAFRPTDWPKP